MADHDQLQFLSNYSEIQRRETNVTLLLYASNTEMPKGAHVGSQLRGGSYCWIGETAPELQNRAREAPLITLPGRP